MKEFKFIKTNIWGAVDDTVKDLKTLKEKSKLLEGNVYQNGMLVYVEDKKAVYKVKEV